MGKWILAALLQACRIASWPAAGLHALLARARLVELPPAIALSPSPRWRVLCDCWRAKAIREALPFVLGTPLRGAAMARVFLDRARLPAGGVVVATIHTSWTKLLSRWCRDRGVRVLARGGFSRDLGTAAIDSRFTDLRHIVASLRAGDMLFIAADAFADHDGCPVQFLGEVRLASLLAARLASAAGVPVVAAIPVYRDGRFTLALGPALHPRTAGEEEAATRAVMAELERMILEHPDAWNETIRGAVGWWRRRPPALVAV